MSPHRPERRKADRQWCDQVAAAIIDSCRSPGDAHAVGVFHRVDRHEAPTWQCNNCLLDGATAREGFLLIVVLAGLALFLWGVPAPSPGRAPFGAQLILYGTFAAVTGTMVGLSARAARRYRRLRLTGLASAMTVRDDDDGLHLAAPGPSGHGQLTPQ